MTENVHVNLACIEAIVRVGGVFQIYTAGGHVIPIMDGKDVVTAWRAHLESEGSAQSLRATPEKPEQPTSTTD